MIYCNKLVIYMFSLKFFYLILLLLFLNLLYIYNDIINDIFYEKKIE